MCSIFGSFSRDKIVELANLNMYRGQHSYSFSYYDPEIKNITYMQRSFGPIPLDKINIPEGQYCIAHMQAPTTDNKSASFIHPAMIGNGYLWHNGIIKDRWIKETIPDIELSDFNTWDTYLILRQYGKTKDLNNIDGTFSCLYYQVDEGLQLFRNEISPMFIDDDSNISSTKFSNSRSLAPNIVWKFVPGQPDISKLHEFKTVENPYFFMETA